MSIKLQHRNNFRGIRKCPKCGTFNGNRATGCKNRSCQQKLRDDTDTGKSGPSTQPSSAVQLIQNNRQLYSVYQNGVRNFIETYEEPNDILSIVLVPSGATDSTAKSCDIAAIRRLVLDCKDIANGLSLRKAIVDSLLIPEAGKRFLYEKQSQCLPDPLVQRVGVELFAVGQLQTTCELFHVVLVRKNHTFSHFQCDCQSANHRKAAPAVCWHILAVAAGLLSAPEKNDERWEALLGHFIGQPIAGQHYQESDLECTYESIRSIEAPTPTEQPSIAGQNIEMIDCILNPTMMELFNDEQALISFDALIDMPTDRAIFELAIGDGMVQPSPSIPCSSDMITTNAENLHLMDCQIELMDEFDLTDRIDFCPSDIECDESMLLSASVIENLSTKSETKGDKKEKLVEVTAKKSVLRQGSRLEKEKLIRGSYNVRKLMKALESNGVVFNQIKRPGSSNNGTTPPLPVYEATLCNLSFTGWLEAVIEQLNAIIDYNADGKPATQTFRIHEDFYRCLRARFSVGHRLRKPEKTHSAERERSTVGSGQRPQLFRFTHHKSLLDVFRTDRIQLSFEKCFIRSEANRFVAIDLSEDVQEKDAEVSSVSAGLRPYRYSTYIKIGRYKHEPDPERVYNFSLEWTGGVLPRSAFGDLRISFEYGHRINNQYVAPPDAGLQ